MGFRFGFVSGFGAGYYLGARAGRHRYEQINRTLSKARRSPVVETAAEKAAGKARSLVDRDRDGAGPAAEGGDSHPVVAPSVSPDVVVADAAVTDVVVTDAAGPDAVTDAAVTDVVVTDTQGVADVITVDPGDYSSSR